MIIVLKINFITEKKNERWLAIFTKKYLKSNYVNKRRAIKVFSFAKNQWVYYIIYNKYQLCEEKERKIEIIKKIVLRNDKIFNKLIFIEDDLYYI